MELDITVDTIDRRIDEDVREAQASLIELATEDQLATEEPRWWTAHELKVRARNGWSSAVVGLALQDLIAEGKFEQGPDLRVRLSA